MEFDQTMQQRLLAFQQHHGLTGDGVAGTQTWTGLMSAPAGAQPATGPTGRQRQVIPLSDYPHLQALLEAESADNWLASLGITDDTASTENEALA